MKLATLLKEVETVFVNGPVDREIRAIAYDSRKVERQPGALRRAAPGEKAGRRAVCGRRPWRPGAVAVIAENAMSCSPPA